MKSVLYFVIFIILMAMMSLPGISTVQGLQNYSRNDTAMLFATGQPVTKSRVDSGNRGNSDCMFNFEGACSLNVRVNTSDSATCNKLDINNTSVSPCCNTGNWCTVFGSRINLGIRGINITTTDCSNISMDVIVKSVTCSGFSMNCEDHERNCTDWTTFAIIGSTTSSNLTTKQTENESTQDNILVSGMNSTNATTTESPDVTNTGSALKSMYTFLTVLGAILLAVFILVCICFCRTKSPKISQNLSANDLWPDRDVIQRLHSTDFSPYTPYSINPVYKDYFDERSNVHVRKPNRYSETACRAHPPTPTLPTHCCSGKSHWSPPATESPTATVSPSGDIYSLSYRKTDFYIDNASGNESDV